MSNFLAQGKPRGSDKDKPDEIVIDDESDSENGDASTIKSELRLLCCATELIGSLR